MHTILHHVNMFTTIRLVELICVCIKKNSYVFTYIMMKEVNVTSVQAFVAGNEMFVKAGKSIYVIVVRIEVSITSNPY